MSQRIKQTLHLLVLFISLLKITSVSAFITVNNRASFVSKEFLSKTLASKLVDTDTLTSTTNTDDDGNDTDSETEQSAASFLKFIGPYPSLPLRFPSLSTESQRERNITGVSLDFILDTAANTNTINAQVATELQLEVVGEALPGYGATGDIQGGASTFMLGNCALDMPNNETFMVNLTASALPIASPAAAGLLGIAFLNCFEGGVRFDWGGGIDDRPPMVTFHGEEDERSGVERLRKVPINILEKTLLPSVLLNINGVEIPALLDTGSPITVLNSVAAEMANVKVIELETDAKEAKEGGFNPFKKFTNNFKEAQILADAASKGDVILMGGANGERIVLKKSINKESLSLNNNGDDNNEVDEEIVSFSSSNIYVGDLPGLAALGGFEGSSSSAATETPPAAILGMDVIKRLPIMVYKKNAVYF